MFIRSTMAAMTAVAGLVFAQPTIAATLAPSVATSPASIDVEGINAQRVAPLHQHGIKGAGIFVGVISDGVDDLAAAQAAGYLPQQIYIVPGYRGSGNDGIAMLEAVHAIAPGAKLGFCAPDATNPTATLLTCYSNLSDTWYANIIVDGLTFPGGEFYNDFFNGTLFLDTLRTFATNHPNVNLVTGAGDDRQDYFEHAWGAGFVPPQPPPPPLPPPAPPPIDLTPNYTPGSGGVGGRSYSSALNFAAIHSGAPQDGANLIKLGSGVRLRAALTWNDPIGAYDYDDLDLFLLAQDGSVLASSTFDQANNPAIPGTGWNPPGEYIDYTNANASTEDIYLVALCYSCAHPIFVKLYGNLYGNVFGNIGGIGTFEYNTEGSITQRKALMSTTGIPGTPLYLDVAAAQYNGSGVGSTMEPYSASGPYTYGYWNAPSLQTAAQPDIAGIDRITVSGGNPTSTGVAAANVAGVLALLRGVGFTTAPTSATDWNRVLTSTANAASITPAVGIYRRGSGLVDARAAGSSLDAAPIAAPASVTTFQVRTITARLHASAAAPLTALNYVIVNGPRHGTLAPPAGTSSRFSYTPAPNYYTASVAFTFEVNDGFKDSNVATETIHIRPGDNRPPVAHNGQIIALPTSAPTPGTLKASDPDQWQTLNYSLITYSDHGIVIVTPDTGGFTYAPTQDGWTGTDSFTWKANDGFDDSNVATEKIVVVSQPPTANDGSVTTDVNQNVDGQLSAQSPSPDLTLTHHFGQPAHGGLIAKDVNAGTFTYQPNTGYAGTDSFSFYVTDGVSGSMGISNIATETITVTDHPPVAVPASASTTTNVAVNGQLQATNSDAGQTLSFSVVREPAHGTVTLNTGSGEFTYTPGKGYAGSDIFTFQAYDGYMYSNVATVTISIADILPTASDGTVSTGTNESVKGRLVAQANNPNQILVYTATTQPANGTLDLNTDSGDFTYTPDTGYAGTDSFKFKANDGTEDSNTATETIAVDDHPPVATGGSVTTIANQNVGGQLKASNPDEGQPPLTYAVADKAEHGEVTLDTATGAFTYAPTKDFTGTDRFTFTANDGYTDSNVATETITVKRKQLPGGGGGGGFGGLGLGLLTGLAFLLRRKR